MSKILVAFFSASGRTKKVATVISKCLSSDIHEIVPVRPYTKADLNWINRNSRSSVEMRDRSCRPEIQSKVEDMSEYDMIFVGFPIWWYREPSIIDTFIEAYDLTGKTVIPFATSGSSGLGETSSNLRSLSPGANVLEGERFSRLSSESKIREWAQNFL